MVNAVKDSSTRLARYAAYVTGLMESLHADHQAHLQFPGVRRTLPQDEIERGFRAGKRWLGELQTRQTQPGLPDHVRRRGEAARTAARLAGVSGLRS